MIIDHRRQVQLSNPAMSELLQVSVNTVAHIYTKDIQLRWLNWLKIRLLVAKSTGNDYVDPSA